MKLALIGFGVVGQGLVRILHEKQKLLAEQYGFRAGIVAVADKIRGTLAHPDGLDPLALLKTTTFDTYPETQGLIRDLGSSEDLIRQSNADVMIEVTPTHLKTGEPALSYCRLALETGKHVVTTNKGPIALAYAELSDLARQKGLYLGFEGTVMAGTPTMTLGLNALAGCTVSEIRGILNGTTNYILTQMEAGQPYSAVLEEAQALGYAEADPTADVEGFDALSKVLILANTLMGGRLRVEDVPCKGITSLTLEDIRRAQQEQKRWKLIGSVRRDNDGVVAARVEPVLLPLSDPLASVSGVTNAITFTTDLLGSITMVGPGAGQLPTGFAVLSDLLQIHRRG